MPRRAPRHLALLALLALPGLPAPAGARPTVRVRAETRIELRVTREPGRVVVEGTLRDDRGDALADRPVEIRIAEPDDGPTRGREVSRTDRSGRLAVSFPLETGRYRVLARFEGEPGYRGVEVAQTLDLERAHVRLGMSRADGGSLDRLDLDVPEHRIRVHAGSPEGGDGLRVVLSNELERPLAEGTTGADGTVTLRVPSDALGPPAAGRLVVRTPGDERRAAAQTEVLVVRFRPTRLELAADAERVRPGEPLGLSGRLFDSAGPVARKAVGLFADEAHLATVLTDDEGAFDRAVRLEGADGPVALHARYATDAPWRPSARSEPVTIDLASRGATPWQWLLLPMALCAALLFWLSRRGGAGAAPEARPEPTAAAPPGIVAGRTSARAAERRAVAGRVLDADEGEPLDDATVALTRGDAELRTASDAAGGFRFETVPAGEWVLRVSRPGFEPRETAVSVPHRGQWESLRVRLRSLRQLALATYRPVAEALAPERRWWAFWTPRELLARARPEDRPELSSLTEAVERAAFGAALPRDRDVEEIARRSEQIARRIDGRRESPESVRASDR